MATFSNAGNIRYRKFIARFNNGAKLKCHEPLMKNRVALFNRNIKTSTRNSKNKACFQGHIYAAKVDSMILKISSNTNIKDIHTQYHQTLL